MTTVVACSRFATFDDWTNCDCGALSEEEIEQYLDEASDVLSIISHGAVTGTCTATIRPCKDAPYCCGLDGGVCCCHVPSIRLAAPVQSVSLVMIDGTALPSGNYRLEGDRLLRTDGLEWPGCQDMLLATTELNTFAITYTFGKPVDAVTRNATVELACALARKFVPSSGIALPPNATFVSHQGIAISRAQAAETTRDVAASLPLVGLFMSIYAPKGPPSFVYSPEIHGGWTYHQV